MMPTIRKRLAWKRLAWLLPVLLLFGISLPATAALRTIEQAYELTRSQVQLPEAAHGGLTVRLCATCNPIVLRVTEATLWLSIPGEQQPAGQAAVLAAFEAAASNPRVLVYVYYEPQTLRVKRIVLDAPGLAAARLAAAGGVTGR